MITQPHQNEETGDPRQPAWSIKRQWFVCALLIFGVLSFVELSVSLRANSDLISERALWIDTEGSASKASAMEKNFLPFDDASAVGFLDGAQWIRVRLSPKEHDLVLTVWPLWLEHVDVYLNEETEAFANLGTADRSDQVSAQIHGTMISLPSDEVHTLWLRVETTTTNFVDVRVTTTVDAMTRTFWMALRIAVYATFLAMIAIGALTAYFNSFEPVFIAFAAKQLAFLNYVFDFHGVPQIVLDGKVADWVFQTYHAFSTFLIVTLFITFEAYFFSLFRPARVIITSLLCMAALPLVWAGLWLFFDERLALTLNAATYLVSLPLLLLAAFTARKTGKDGLQVPRSVLGAYALFIFTSVGVASGAALGIGLNPKPALYWFNMGHGTVIGVFMMFILLSGLHAAWIRNQRMHASYRQARERIAIERHRSEEKSRFLSMLIHELRTPLSIVSITLSLPHRTEKDIGMALDAARNIDAIIDRCLQDHKLHAGALRPEPESLDPGDLIDLAIASGNIPRSRIERYVALQGKMLWGDSQLVVIVLSNLLDNAVKYSAANTQIQVHVVPKVIAKTSGVSIEVINRPSKDSFPDQDRVFTKFYRGQHSSHTSGAGLGLHMSHGLADLMGGHLNYYSDRRGVVFELWMPSQPSASS